jgi:hypothetical protein
MKAEQSSLDETRPRPVNRRGMAWRFGGAEIRYIGYVGRSIETQNTAKQHEKHPRSKAGMSNQINNLSQKWGLDRKLECPLQSTKRGLHRKRGRARPKAGICFRISEAGRGEIREVRFVATPKAGTSFGINNRPARHRFQPAAILRVLQSPIDPWVARQALWRGGHVARLGSPFVVQASQTADDARRRQDAGTNKRKSGRNLQV